MQDNFFAEVIESSLQGWLAQCWQWDNVPQFGSMVAIETKKRILFGVVYQMQTGSHDTMRVPFAYQKTEEELRAEQPQIFAFLRTTFFCVLLGYKEKNNLFHVLAPEPAKIHAFVRPMTYHEKIEFFATTFYLPLLFSNVHLLGSSLEELLLAILREMKNENLLTPIILEYFMQDFSLLTGSDYKRLKLFLQRAQPLITSEKKGALI